MSGMFRCALCNCLLTEDNKTKEHIIPNSIGGRRKVTYFICNKCNNEKGRVWDAELSNQLEFIALFFRIKRERGEPPKRNVTLTSGEDVTLLPNGNMTLQRPSFTPIETDNKNELQFHVVGRDIREAKKIVKDFKKKHPNLKEQNISVTESFRYPSGYIPFSCEFGGENAGRSFVKTFLAQLSASRVDIHQCELALDYLNSDGEPAYGFYYSSDLVTNRVSGLPFHCVSVASIPDEKMIVGYLELFGFIRIVSCLSSNYSGGEFQYTYAVNPLNSLELDLQIDLSGLTRQLIRRSYDYEEISDGAMEEALSYVLASVTEEQKNIEFKRVVALAYEKAIEGLGENPSDQELWEASGRVVKALQPWLLHNFSYQQPRKSNSEVTPSDGNEGAV